TVTASSFFGKKDPPVNILPGKKGAWMSKTSGAEWIELDLKYQKEFGAIKLQWDKTLSGLNYEVLGSFDGKTYDTLRTVNNGKSGPVLIFTPESEAQFIRLALKNNSTKKRWSLDEMSVVPSESLSTANQYFENLAAQSTKGLFPRYFLKQGSFWTVVGVPSDVKEALFNEDGVFEVDKQRFSIEPFIKLENDKNLLTWADAKEEQTLENGYLPIPSVKRIYQRVELKVTLLAFGEQDRSALLARYVVKNILGQREKGSLSLAIRPFQVNPTYQWLNFEGGFAKTDSISIEGNRASVGDKRVIVSNQPSASGATTIDGGEIVEHLSLGKIPSEKKVIDKTGMASAAFQYSFDLTPGDSLVVIAAVPFTSEADRWKDAVPTNAEFDSELAKVKAMWDSKVNTVRFNVPPDAQRYVDIIRSYVAYILINKDKFGFQPGSRSYERSWIRDGSMTSDALLKLGIQDDVKKFIDWYASYQYENGMVPCVVDTRGPDPVPEHDSHGELIFACMEYFRFTADTTFLRSRWPNIVGAVDFIQSLRAQRMTPEYKLNEEKRAFYGLVTESISHEGYSAKPMHSYWDDFFVMKGLKDAAAAAKVLGKPEVPLYDSLVRSFRIQLYSSISLAMKNKKINYVPGCVELGDFDPTSTSIAMFPCGEMNNVLQPAFDSTFDKYYSWFVKRATGEIVWDKYTPYEIRSVGTYVYLGQKERAHFLMDWFLKYNRPQGWNQWAEVVWNNERQAGFIGDMPHTWVGSDYINAVRAMFVYELDDVHSLVLGGGLKDDWVKQGLSVEDLPTHFGKISYSISNLLMGIIQVQIKGTVDAEKSPILIPVSLLSTPLTKATVNGIEVQPMKGFIKVTRLPAKVELMY
ncbi:MAG: discoidin domain-containing protein, partial [Bacteroidota bacterium]|nr:discoidin domain-containing protein [Bacteroidota bacterium]